MKYIEESWKWLPKYEVDRLLLCAKYWLMSLHTSQNPDLYTRYTPSIHHLGYSSFTLQYRIMHFLCLILLTTATALQSPLDISMSRTRTKAGNPVINGWYADPEARIFTSSQNQTQNRNQYWIYPTTSTTYDKQTTFSAFSSRPRNLDTTPAHPQHHADSVEHEPRRVGAVRDVPERRVLYVFLRRGRRGDWGCKV